jgi:autotransporter-associated beta strand protein
VSNKSALACGCVAVILLLNALAACADEYWNVSTGDWSVPGHWNGGAVPTSSDTAYIVNGGTATVSTIGPTCNTLSLGGTAGAGTLQMTGGSLPAADSDLGSPAGAGTFTQSGGTHTVTGILTLGGWQGGTGTYNLNGSGQLSAPQECIGFSGTGLFEQAGGTNNVNCLAIGIDLGVGRYVLSGGTLQVNGGLCLSSGSSFDGGNGHATLVGAPNSLVDLSGGTLTSVGSMNVSMGTGSLLIVPSGFNPSTGFGSLSSSGMIHTLGTTLVVPPGQGFGGGGTITDPVNCQGTITATPNTYIEGVPLGIGIHSGGLTISGTGNVDLGAGQLYIQGTDSGMSGGSLNDRVTSVVGIFTQSGGTHTTGGLLLPNGIASGTYNLSGTGLLSIPGGTESVGGPEGTGSFNQSGGTNSASYLTLGNNSLSCPGFYNLSQNGMLAIAGTECLGYTGPGTFTQSGGTNTAGTLTFGYSSGSSGTYNLNGGTLIVSSISGGSGTVAFKFNGGTLMAGAGFSASLPMTLATRGGNATFDTAGYGVTLLGPLSGPGSLIKADSGTLTLAVSNTYSGTTLVSGGTLALGNSAALQQSTLDTSGSGVLSFGSLRSATLGGLTGPGTLSLTNTAPAAIALSVGNNNNSTTFSGTLQGAGSLTKIGTGTLTVAGNDACYGGISVNAGSLIVAGSVGSTVVTVGGGATLGGTGSIAGTVVVLGGMAPATQGAINLADGMIGTLTLSDSKAADTVLTLGGLTVGNPSVFTFEVGAIADRIRVMAGKVAVNPGGSLINIVPLSGFGPGTYDLMDFPTGQASGLGYLSLATTSVNGYPVYLQSTPTAEQLVAVPEPSTLALLGAGTLGLLAYARRRRRAA